MNTADTRPEPRSGADEPDLVRDELDLLAALAPLASAEIVELGCGDAALARRLLGRHPHSHVTGVEPDVRQHERNLLAPHERLRFVAGEAQALPFEAGVFDGAMMLKSLHHVQVPLMDGALAEVRRVLRPGGWLYVSEPVFAGPLNDIVRLFNDEQAVRAEAQAALDRALAGGGWEAMAERRFDTPVQFADCADFERRMIDVSFADRHIDDALRQEVRARLRPHLGADGARFVRPMHVRVLRSRTH